MVFHNNYLNNIFTFVLCYDTYNNMINNSIKHDGKIVEVSEGKAIAEIMVSEACGTCQAKGLCRTNGKKINVEVSLSNGENIAVGDEVQVAFTPKLALSSVLLAYVLPLLIMFAIMFGVIAATNNQDAGCLIGLAVLPIYYTILYAMRNKLRRKFKFSVYKR